MNYLHYDLNLGSDDVVVVTLDKQANVQLMDESNFSSYKRGQRFTFYGGLAKTSPARVRPPHPGHWHLAIDLGGHSGTVRAAVNIQKA